MIGRGKIMASLLGNAPTSPTLGNWFLRSGICMHVFDFQRLEVPKQAFVDISLGVGIIVDDEPPELS